MKKPNLETRRRRKRRRRGEKVIEEEKEKKKGMDCVLITLGNLIQTIVILVRETSTE